MFFSFRFILISLLSVMLGVAVGFSQSDVVRGPILGFAPNSAGSVIWPIVGVAGASILGEPLLLDSEVYGASVSPKNDYALAIRRDDAQPVVIDLRGDSPELRVITSAEPAVDLIAISPGGSAAATYNSQSKMIQVFGGLPGAAELIYQFNAAEASGWAATQMAVSDDGTIALVKFASDGEAGFWGFDSSGRSWRVSLNRPSAAAFFINSHDAIVADEETQTVFVVTDIARTAVQLPLISTLGNLDSVSALAISADNRQVLAADANTGIVLVVDAQTRTSVPVSCYCHLTGLSHLKGNSVLRLNEPSETAMSVLDSSDANARILLTPPRRPQ